VNETSDQVGLDAIELEGGTLATPGAVSRLIITAEISKIDVNTKGPGGHTCQALGGQTSNEQKQSADDLHE
jgi:hypothetical protein